MTDTKPSPNRAKVISSRQTMDSTEYLEVELQDGKKTALNLGREAVRVLDELRRKRT